MAIADAVRRAIVGGHRTVVVRARVGQGVFRVRLLEEQGEICAFTGPAPWAVLEAAHLYSYATTGVHHDDGGLLLRRDIHRLFDLGHIAVQPERLVLHISEELAEYHSYRPLHGVPIQTPLVEGQRRWLAEHWRVHREPSA
ncbi:HNH endonuclease [Yinghuangia sp. ASG 101]|uniref:HNH endonuclease signature motif containing protein n=1 Tax=Yinghuangia sp. ASG 101 TaxID=2896848 RepID=UPI001E5F062F|nr:HNH endonuclease signature motif containing protein [Yinghuangia sp. ASG 101]UGQ14663.1 HNH endonuclease [Yinghuangia sp. ASG 101]